MRHSVHSIFIDQADEKEAAERYDEALELLYQVHRWAPDSPELWLRMGVLSFLLTDRDWLIRRGKEASTLGDMGAVNAELYLSRAVALAPESGMTRFWLGWVRHALYQDAAGARHELERALDLDPAIPYPHAGLARILLAEGAPGDAERALAHLARAIALLPESARFHYDEGACLMRLGQPDRAHAAFERAMACPPLSLGRHAIARYMTDTFHGDGAGMRVLVGLYYGGA